MPNHCSNRLTVTGPKAERTKLRISMKSPEEDFSIQRFRPEPPELVDIHSGCTTINGVRVENWRALKDGTCEAVNEVELKRKYGAANLHDWHCKTYGTKWGTYDSRIVTLDDELVYRFQTAWYPLCDDIMLLLSATFPTLEFKYEFAERGMNFAGRIRYKAGEKIEHYNHELKDEDFRGVDEDYEYKHDDEWKELIETSG